MEKRGQIGALHSSPQAALPRNFRAKPDSRTFFTNGSKEVLKLEGRSPTPSANSEASRKTHVVSGPLRPSLNQPLGCLTGVSTGSEIQDGQNWARLISYFVHSGEEKRCGMSSLSQAVIISQEDTPWSSQPQKQKGVSKVCLSSSAHHDHTQGRCWRWK